MEIYSLEDLENYLGKLNELGEDELDSARQEMITILEKLIDNLTGMQRYMIGKKIYGD